MRSKLFDFFPVPKSLAMHTSGVAVSDRAVQFVRFAQKRKIEIEDYGEVLLPDNVIEGGSVTAQKEFIDTLSTLKKKHKLDLVEVSIPEEKSYLFKTTVLGEDIKEIANNIELRIQDNVPFSVAEVVFDFSIISQPKEGKRDVVVSVLPRTVAQEYVDCFQQAGLTPTSFQVESQAVAQAVVPRDNSKTVLVVNIQEDKAGLYVVTGQTVHFSSTVSIDGAVSDVRVIDELATTSSQKDGSVNLSTLVREIKKILTYWRTHDGGEDGAYAITHVYLVGSIVEEVKTTDYVGSALSIPVEIANVWNNVFSFDTTIPEMPRGDSLRYAAAIGLALPNQE